MTGGHWIALSRISGGLPALFLLVDAGAKILQLTPYVEGSARLGFGPSTLVPLGLIEGICTLIYLVPRTAVLGAVLLTGFLGGAVAAHLRQGDPVFSLVFPFLMGSMLWGGLWLRSENLRALIPFRTVSR
jgi:hypothetical protein